MIEFEKPNIECLEVDDESKILLSEFPIVTPYPLSNGSHTNFA